MEQKQKTLKDLNLLDRFLFQMCIRDRRCLEDVGMTSIEPIMYNGQEIVPLQFLKAVLPDPSSLGPRTKGKTNIGCIFIGKKDGKEKTLYIYNTCDHQECYKAVSYTHLDVYKRQVF